MTGTPLDRTSLQTLIDSVPNLVDFFFDETAPPAPHRQGRLDPYIPREFTNWRQEQRAWRETAVLFDQSHHMPELFVSGPDAEKMLQYLAVNSFGNFTTGRAKQFVCCTPRGDLIADCIIYRHADDSFELVSGWTVLDWVEYNAQSGRWNVDVVRDVSSPFNPNRSRTRYRFQVQGPQAAAILAEAVDGEMPELGFFRTAKAGIAGGEATLLRHGMTAEAGVEISGPFAEMDRVRDTLIAAGSAHGMMLGGTYSYFSTSVESGWPGFMLSGIYTGEDLRGFREWLPGVGWEAGQHLGGSFRTKNIEDYYVNPWDLGYDRTIKFDHDFIGREALEQEAERPHRRHVALLWNADDVLRIYRSELEHGPRYKSLDVPVVSYGYPHYDEARTTDGSLAGLSTFAGYSANDRLFVSVGMIDERYATEGTELVITWGERDGGSGKPEVEPHVQTQIRAVVAPWPYRLAARSVKSATFATTTTTAVQ